MMVLLLSTHRKACKLRNAFDIGIFVPDWIYGYDSKHWASVHASCDHVSSLRADRG